MSDVNDFLLNFTIPYPVLSQLPERIEDKPNPKASFWNSRYGEVDENFKAIAGAVRQLGKKPNYVRFDTQAGGAGLPAGTTQEREEGFTGKLRYNITLEDFEGYTGGQWVPFGLKNLVRYDHMQGSAQLPYGSTDQAGEPLEGRMRFNDVEKRFEGANGERWLSLGGGSGSVPPVVYNTTTQEFEGYNGNTWEELPIGKVVVFDYSFSGGLIPKGTTNQRGPGVLGKFRYNTTTKEFEGYSDAGWISFKATNIVKTDGAYAGGLIPVGTSENSGEPTAGKFRYNTDVKGYEFGDGVQWVGLVNYGRYATFGKYLEYDTLQGGGLLPYGTEDTKGQALKGKTRYNTTRKRIQFFDGLTWRYIQQYRKVLNRYSVDEIDIAGKDVGSGYNYKGYITLRKIKVVLRSIVEDEHDIYLEYEGLLERQILKRTSFTDGYIFMCLDAAGDIQFEQFTSVSDLLTYIAANGIKYTHYGQVMRRSSSNNSAEVIGLEFRKINRVVRFYGTSTLDSRNTLYVSNSTTTVGPDSLRVNPPDNFSNWKLYSYKHIVPKEHSAIFIRVQISEFVNSSLFEENPLADSAESFLAIANPLTNSISMIERNFMGVKAVDGGYSALETDYAMMQENIYYYNPDCTMYIAGHEKVYGNASYGTVLGYIE